MKRTMSLAALAVILTCGTSSAQQVNVKIGVLTDMSSLYADATGIGSVIAARMAIRMALTSSTRVLILSRRSIVVITDAQR